MARALAYIRVSKEKEDGISPELQLAAIQKHCTEHGHTIVETIEDLDLSGRFWKRRQVDRAVGMIERREADVIVVWKLSRVSRNRVDWNIAVDRVESVGGHLESATEPMDTTTSSGRFARGVLAELAAFESERIGEQWKETHARRLRLGLPVSGKPRFGYTYTREDGYVPDPAVSEVLHRMYLDYIGGAGFAKLANVSREHGGPKEAAGVKRMMDAGFAAGLVIHKGQMYPGAHEGLLDEVTWGRYLKARKQRTPHRSGETQHPFSGIVKCACGSWMGGNRYVQRGVQKTKYGCAAYRYGAQHTNSITEPVVERAVLEFLSGVVEEVNAKTQDHLARNGRKRRVDARPKLKADLALVLGRIDSLTEKYLDAKVSPETYDRMLAKYEKDAAALQDRIDHLDAQEAGPPPAQLAADLLAHWDVMPAEVKRTILSKLIDRVEVPLEPGSRWSPKDVRLVPLWEA